MKYDPTIHHRNSIRLKGYDYSLAGLYFITICCHNKISRFGQIENGKMTLNECGQIANEYWLEIPKHYPNVVLHEHIIMPNHVHGIIELINDVIVGVENFQPLHQQHAFQKIIPRSIGSIIRGFKIGTTKWVRQNTSVYNIWQRNYYEHIIRNEKSYRIISEYILTNPENWEDDRLKNSNFSKSH